MLYHGEFRFGFVGNEQPTTSACMQRPVTNPSIDMVQHIMSAVYLGNLANVHGTTI